MRLDTEDVESLEEWTERARTALAKIELAAGDAQQALEEIQGLLEAHDEEEETR